MPFITESSVRGGSAETDAWRRGAAGLAGPRSRHALRLYRIGLASKDDAAALLPLHRLDAESPFMLLEPSEREQGRVASFDLIVEGEESGGAVAWLSLEVAPFRPAQHTSYLVIGVDGPRYRPRSAGGGRA